MKRFFTVSFDWLFEHWRGIASALIVATLAVLTLSLQLGTLISGENKYETELIASLAQFPLPWQAPVNAPYLVPTYLVGTSIDDMLLAGRIVSVVYGLLAAACMFYVLKKWFRIRMATVGTLLFITSSWLLHIAHVATPLILMVFAPMLCLAAFTWLLHTKKWRYLAIFAFAGAVAFACYVPYMAWMLLVTFGVLFFRQRDTLRQIEPWHWLAGTSFWALLTLPLIVGVVTEPGVVKILLGIPAVLPSIVQYFQNMASVFLLLFFRSPLLPELHLGRLPLLDIFTTTMFFLGCYHFARKLTNRRTLILFISFAILILVVPLSPRYQLAATIFMPLVYLCVTSGVVELLQQWYAYFPRNPLARTVGVAFVAVAIGLTTFYHLQRYFIAWPNTPDTKNVYVIKSKQ